MQKQRISFLTEEIVEENLEEMQKYHNRPDLTGSVKNIRHEEFFTRTLAV